MDDPSMTMEEYIKLEEEKARMRGWEFNWQTATYGKIRIDDDLHNLSSVKAEFPAIVINDAFAPHDALQCKCQVITPFNDEIDFRISFDESDDEDYTIIYRTVKYPKGIAKNVPVGIGKFVFTVDVIILYMPEDVKVPLIIGKPFLSTAQAKIDVFKKKITLRVREEKIDLAAKKSTKFVSIIWNPVCVVVMLWKENHSKDSYDDDDFDDPSLTDAQMKFANAFDINLHGQLR
ncbi:hypothetical protein Tco_1165032 [Tanacetum coccineum]